MLIDRARLARGLAAGRAFLTSAAARARRLRAASVGLARQFAAAIGRVWASVANIRSERLRDRAAASATFAAIALFGALSLDVLLGGGAQLGSSAEAAQPAGRFVVLTALPDIPYQAPAATIAAPADRARVVAVSYSPAAEQLLGWPIAGEEEKVTTDGEIEPTPESADAPVKIEAPTPTPVVKTVPF